MGKFAAALLAVLVAGPAGPACARNETEMNAFLLVDSESAVFSEKFRKYLADNGARIIRSFGTRAFIGYVPPALDKTLKTNYGTAVYRERIEMNQLAGYGESVVYAANEWNKHFLDGPSEAPLVISHRVRRAKKGDAIALSWNVVRKAVEYRLEISRDADFNEMVLGASPKQNRYDLPAAFFADGVYYWRVAAVTVFDGDEKRRGPLSEAYSFAVSKPPSSPGAPPAAPALPAAATVRGDRTPAWEKNPACDGGGAPRACIYRVQVARTGDFSDLIADDFTGDDYYVISGLPLAARATYYMRVMAASRSVAGPWSRTCAFRIEE